MRKRIVAANWKMNKTLEEVKSFIVDFKNSINSEDLSDEKQVVISTPYIYLTTLVHELKDFPYVSIAAQNCHTEDKGAYTGEVSAQQLQSIGVTHVILGHSERREYFQESDEIVLQKIKKALEYNLTPIFCCGEALDERENGTYKEFILQQLEASIFKLDESDIQRITIAYEPIWAIGTGNTASVEQAQEIHSAIRTWIAEKYGNDIAQNMSILYGGSCNPTNASSIFSQEDVDGGLIGGASLQVVDFEQIITAL